MTKPTRATDEPIDELGRLANEALKLIEGLNPDVRVVVFVENNQMCMTALGGWDSDLDAVVAVLAHLTKVFEANGKTLMIVPLGKG